MRGQRTEHRSGQGTYKTQSVYTLCLPPNYRQEFYSIRAAAKEMGIAFGTLRYRVVNKTVEHALINGRAWIPDFVLEAESTLGDSVHGVRLRGSGGESWDVWRERDIKLALTALRKGTFEPVSYAKRPGRVWDRVDEHLDSDGCLVLSHAEPWPHLGVSLPALLPLREPGRLVHVAMPHMVPDAARFFAETGERLVSGFPFVVSDGTWGRFNEDFRRDPHAALREMCREGRFADCGEIPAGAGGKTFSVLYVERRILPDSRTEFDQA